MGEGDLLRAWSRSSGKGESGCEEDSSDRDVGEGGGEVGQRVKVGWI